jgi:SAM-dependent methyltransferase
MTVHDERAQHDQHHDHGGGQGGHGDPRGRHGNPEDLEAYLARLEDPERAAWQKPDLVVRALRLRPGQTACELGAGPGYFAFRLARAVGRGGRVYAVDAEPRMLEYLAARIRKVRARNVTPVLGLDDDPLLPARSCDVILTVNTYHHFPDGPAFLRRLGRSLRPGGRIANVDFHRRETPVGPPVEHRIAREEFLRQARRAGLTVVAELPCRTSILGPLPFTLEYLRTA